MKTNCSTNRNGYEKVKRCCAVCEHYYDMDNCPCYTLYDLCKNNGHDKEADSAKYTMLCEKFTPEHNLL